MKTSEEKKKTILITGASSGFGMLATKSLALEGYHVIATLRKTRSRNVAAVKALREWAEENNCTVSVVDLDITDPSGVDRAVQRIAALTDGQIDVLINNAGVGSRGIIETFATSQIEEVYRVNVFGSDRMIKAVVPYMRKRGEGLILQVTSVLARMHLPFLGVYCSSKSAIDALAEVYHYELKPFGIDVAIVQPGAYPTEISGKQVTPKFRELESHYSDLSEQIKEVFRHVFPPTVQSKDPGEVVEVMSSIIKQPSGQRALWYTVGGEAAHKSVEKANEATLQLAHESLGETLTGHLKTV